jgi:hypothetical protein
LVPAQADLAAPPGPTAIEPPHDAGSDPNAAAAPAPHPASTPPFEPQHFSVVARVGRNHGHVFSVELYEVAAAAEHNYDLRGDSDHSHQVNITADEFRALQQGATLRKQSERGGSNAHRHRLMLRLDPKPLPPERVNACWIQIGGKDDHELVIPESHVRGGLDQTYDIQGVAPHTHSLALTAQDFEALLAGKQLDIETGRGLGHFHHVYLRYPLS